MRDRFAWCMTVAFRTAVVLLTAGGAAQAGKSFLLDQDKAKVFVIDAHGEVTASFATPPGPSGIAITPDCAKLYVGGYAQDTVSVFDPARGVSLGAITVGKQPRHLTITADGAKLYTANDGSVDVSVIDTARDAVAATIQIGDTPVGNLSGPAITPDGNKAYVSDQPSNFVAVIDTASDRVTARIEVGNKPDQLVMSPDGRKVYVANLYSRSVSVMSTATDKVVATADVGIGPDQMFVTRNGKVYAGTFGDVFSIIDPAADKVIGTILKTDGSHGALSSDGTRLYIDGPVFCPGRSSAGIIGAMCEAERKIYLFFASTTDFVSVINTEHDSFIGTVPNNDPGRLRARQWSMARRTPENANCR